jgi:hypothetical protein
MFWWTFIVLRRRARVFELIIDCTCIQAKLHACLNTVLSGHLVLEALEAAARRPRSNFAHVSRDIVDGGGHRYICQTEHSLSCRRSRRLMEVVTSGKGQPRVLGRL